MIDGSKILDHPIRWAMVRGGKGSQIGYIHRSAALRDNSFQLVAGLHVVCEKPLCFTSAEAEKLVALAKEKNRVVGSKVSIEWHDERPNQVTYEIEGEPVRVLERGPDISTRRPRWKTASAAATPRDCSKRGQTCTAALPSPWREPTRGYTTTSGIPASSPAPKVGGDNIICVSYFGFPEKMDKQALGALEHIKRELLSK